MNMEKEAEAGVLVKGRATIDTRPPFRSVKEAVALFGERVLVGEIYAKQLKEMQPTKASTNNDHATSTLGVVSAELEETKQSLQKTREEGNYMANCLKSLKDELEQTKKELQHLKASKHVVIHHPKTTTMNSLVIEKPKMINPEIEELKFVENPMFKQGDFSNDNGIYQHEEHKKRFVTFASPPSLTKEIVPSPSSDNEVVEPRLGKTPSFRRDEKKIKPVIPIMGWLLSRKKKNHEVHDHNRSPKA